MVKTKAKRLLSLLLAFAMVMSLTVTPVYAADDDDTSSGTEASETGGESSTSEDYVGEIEQVVAVATDDDVVDADEDSNAGIAMIDEDGGTTASELPTAVDGVITLTENVELAEQYVVSETTTIDLKGYTITRASTNTTAGLIKVTSGTLTVQDTSTSANGSIDGATYVKDGTTYVGYGIWMEGGTVNVNSGTVTGYRGIYGTAGTLNVTGGTVSGTQIGIMANGTLAVNVSGSAVVTGAHSAIYGYQDTYTGTVTVSGGTVGGSSTQYAINMIAGNLVVSGSAVVNASKSVSESWVYAIYLGVGVTAKISDSASITATNSAGYSAGIVYFGNSDSENPTTLEIEGGTISGTTYGLSGNGSASYSEVTISGGTISSDFIAIYHPEMGDITISGGTITGVYAGIQLIAGNLTVTGGTITATATEDDVNDNPNSVANKTGDGAIADGAAISIINRSGYGNTQSGGTVSYGSVTVSGGTVTSADGVDAVQAYTYSSNTATALTTNVTVTGGTYSSDVSEYCTGTLVATEDGSGNYIITSATAVASIGDTEYATLARAFAAAQSGDTITLLADVTLSESLIYDRDGVAVTLDLYGNTITFAYDDDKQFNGETLTDGAWGLKVASGSMTIKDSSTAGTGTIQTADENTFVDVVGASGTATLTIESGNFTTNSIYEAVVFATSEAKVYITGGTFTNSAESYAYNDDFDGIVLNVGNSSSATITVTGGTFYGESPASGDDSSSTAATSATFIDKSNYAAYEYGDGGYVVAKADCVAAIYEGGTYVASYTTLAYAFEAVEDGQTIVLLGDVTVTDATYNGSGLYQVSGKTVTLDLGSHTLSVDTTRVFGVLDGGSLTIKDGTVKIADGTSASTTQFNILRGACSFTAENVTFDANKVAANFLHVASGGTATIALTNCDITNQESGVVVYDEDGNSTVTLTGCNYTQNPSGGSLNDVTKFTIIFNSHNTIGEDSANWEANNTLRYTYIVADGGSVTADLTLAATKGAASLTVQEGGSVTGNIKVVSGTTLTIEGGAVTGSITTEGTFVMTGGTVTGSGSGQAVLVKGGSVAISGGTITNTNKDGSNARALVFDTDATVSGTISSGTFVGADIALLARSSSYNEVSVTGGTYTATKGIDLVANILESGYGVFDTEGNTVTASGNYYTSTLEDNTVVVGLANAVAAIGTTRYATIADAVAAAGTSDTTITLLASTSEDVVIPEGATITLDLNGYTLTNSTSHTIINYGTLTITDSTATVSEDGTLTCGTVDNVTNGKAALVNYGTATLLGGTYKRSAEAGTSSSENGGNSYYTIKNYYSLTVGKEGETTCNVVVKNSGSYSSCVANGYQNTSDKTRAQAITGDVTPTLTIYGGSFSGGIATIKNDDCAILTIDGGSFSNSYQDVIQNHSTATINDGTFTATGTADVIYNCGCDDSIDVGVLTITGGTFDASESSNSYVLEEVSTADTATVTIKDGSFTGKIWSSSSSVADWDITGGSYSDDSADTYLTGTSYQVAYNSSATEELAYKVVSVIYGKNINLSEGKIILNVYVTNNSVTSVDSITGSLDDERDTARTTKEAVTGKDNYAYVLSQKVSAEKMTNTLTVIVALSGDYEGYVVTYKTSVQEYAVEMLETLSASSKEYAVLKAMLNYGAALQAYSSYNTSTLANEGYAYTSNELSDASTMSTAGVTLTETYSSNSYDGAYLGSMSVYYDYDFTVRLTYSQNIESAVTEVTLNGVELTKGTNYTVSGKVISISGLSAYQMNQTICVKTTDSSSNTLTTSLPGLYYAYLLADSSKDTTKFLARTLYTYCTAVKALYTTGS